MVAALQQIHLNVRSSNYDPTRTLHLRNTFSAQIAKRFRELRGVIRKAIVDEDCFGLTDLTSQQMSLPGRRAFAFPRSQDKVEAFMAWLREQEKSGVLELGDFQRSGGSIDQAWTNIYVKDSYKRGVIRARYELKKVGFSIPSDEGIEALLSTPFHADRLGLLYTRVFAGLKGITEAMDLQISQILAQGMADGENPRALARLLTRVISGPSGDLGLTDTLGRFIPAERRARMLARTEIIRGHHLATIQEYRNWEIEGVRVQVEWETAGYNVCPICSSMQGKTYTLKQIETMIPAHPNCRCVALPSIENEAEIASAVDETPISEVESIESIQDKRIGSAHLINPDQLQIDVYSDKVVNEYAKRIQAGEDMIPSFIDKNNLSHISDGNHRAAAYAKLNRPVPVVLVDRIDMLIQMGTGNLSARDYYNLIRL